MGEVNNSHDVSSEIGTNSSTLVQIGDVNNSRDVSPETTIRSPTSVQKPEISPLIIFPHSPPVKSLIRVGCKQISLTPMCVPMDETRCLKIEPMEFLDSQKIYVSEANNNENAESCLLSCTPTFNKWVSGMTKVELEKFGCQFSWNTVNNHLFISLHIPSGLIIKNLLQAKSAELYEATHLKTNLFEYFLVSDESLDPQSTKIILPNGNPAINWGIADSSKSQIENFYGNVAVSKLGVSHNYQIREENLQNQLKEYQKDAVRWMMHRELNPDFEDDATAFNVRIESSEGTLYYFPVFGVFTSSLEGVSEFFHCAGGILADEMGLGKTVEVISLITSLYKVPFEDDGIRREKSTLLWNPCNMDMRFELFGDTYVTSEAIKKLRRTELECQPVGLVCKLCSDKFSPNHLQFLSELSGSFVCPFCVDQVPKFDSKATLIVTPSALVNQWLSELAKHGTDKLKILRYYGVKHDKYVHPSEFNSYDVVLTTFETLSNEFSFMNIEKRSLRRTVSYKYAESPLTRVNFWRVVIDESQLVSWKTGKTAAMCANLSARAWWHVSGTPCAKDIEEIYQLIMCLNVKPFNNKNFFNFCLESFRQKIEGSESAPSSSREFNSFCTLFSNIMWRNTKDLVKNELALPKLNIKTIPITFSSLEERVYKKRLEDVRKKIGKATNIIKGNGKNVLLTPNSDCLVSSLSKNVRNQIMAGLQSVTDTLISRGESISGDVLGDPNKYHAMDHILMTMMADKKTDIQNILRSYMLNINEAAGIVREIAPNLSVELYEKELKYQESINEFNASVKKKILEIGEKKQEKSAESTSSNTEAMDESSGIEIEEDTMMGKRWDANLAEKVAVVPDTTVMYHLATNYLETADGSDQEKVDLCTAMKQSTRDHFIRRESEKIAELKEEFQQINEKWEEQDLIHRLHTISNRLRVKYEQLERKKLSREDRLLLSQQYPMFSQPDVRNDVTDALNKIEQYLANIPGVVSLISTFLTDNPNISSELMENTCDQSHRNFGAVPLLDACLLCQLLQKLNDLVDERRLNSKPFLFLLTYFEMVDEFDDDSENVEEEIRKVKELAKETLNCGVNALVHYQELYYRYDELQQAASRVEPKLVMNLDDYMRKVNFKLDIIDRKMTKSINEFNYLLNTTTQEYLECPICFVELEFVWAVTPCCHQYCTNCYEALKRKRMNSTCAVCRQVYNPADVEIVQKTCGSEQPEISGMNLPVKLNTVMRLIRKIITEEPESRIAIFTTLTNGSPVFRYVHYMFRLAKIPVIDASRRCLDNNLQQFFSRQDCKVLLCSLNLCSTGLNMIHANTIIFLDPSPCKTIVDQAIGRINRMGQNREMTVYHMIINNTIDKELRSMAIEHQDKSLNKFTVDDIRRIFQLPRTVEAQMEEGISGNLNIRGHV